MAHGMPDFGIYAPKASTFNLADLADLAVRLGSIVEYDRRGDVILLDDCEAPVIKPDVDKSPAATVELSTTAAVSGVQSIRLLTPAAIGTYAGVIYYQRPIVRGRHGASFATNFYNMATVDGYLRVAPYLVSATKEYTVGIRFHVKDHVLQYLAADGTYTTFATGVKVLVTNQPQFHQLKLVFDLDTGKYVRFLLDMEEWDLSAYAFKAVSGAYNLDALTEIKAITNEATAIDVLIDDFVYTINEP